MDELQVENGNYTRIVNPLIERLIQIPFKGCELAVAIFIIRKTYGFQKTEDEISITQFENGIKRSRQTIVTALKNLKLVNIAILVEKGNSKKQSNVWKINKYYHTWELVKLPRLVKRKRGTSLTEASQLVKTARHTKETTKENTKESTLKKQINNISYLENIPPEDIQDFINKYGITKHQITSKAEDLRLYCESKGKRYKNYRSFLENAIKKDFGQKKPNNLISSEIKL